MIQKLVVCLAFRLSDCMFAQKIGVLYQQKIGIGFHSRYHTPKKSDDRQAQLLFCFAAESVGFLHCFLASILCIVGIEKATNVV